MTTLFDIFWHRSLRRPYQLHVVHHGNHRKPTVVFLHGIAASGEDWRPFIDVFSAQYHCVLIDLLGFGQSPKPQWCSYTMDDHMRSLYHTMNKLHLGKRFTLVGHSLGSLLASRYATEHQSSLARLILLSPPVYPPLDSITDRRARRLTGLLLAGYDFVCRNPRITPSALQRLGRILPLPKSMVRRLQQPGIWIPFRRTLQECIEQQTILDDVAKLTVPTDVYYGSADRVVINSNVEVLGKNPAVTLHKFNGTHDINQAYAEVVAATLQKNRQPKRRRT
jgi:pimeloyl-ACP methyl ester carboxylesterase